MDVAAVEGMSLPAIRLRNRPTHVTPNQKKVRARRKRRKELVVIQICLFGGLLLVVKGFSYLAENSGEDFVAYVPPVGSEGGEQNVSLMHILPLDLVSCFPFSLLYHQKQEM